MQLKNKDEAGYHPHSKFFPKLQTFKTSKDLGVDKLRIQGWQPCLEVSTAKKLKCISKMSFYFVFVWSK